MCETLFLRGNKIGDKGCEALAAALDAGALPKCKVRPKVRIRVACTPVHAFAMPH